MKSITRSVSTYETQIPNLSNFPQNWQTWKGLLGTNTCWFLLDVSDETKRWRKPNLRFKRTETHLAVFASRNCVIDLLEIVPSKTSLSPFPLQWSKMEKKVELKSIHYSLIPISAFKLHLFGLNFLVLKSPLPVFSYFNYLNQSYLLDVNFVKAFQHNQVVVGQWMVQLLKDIPSLVYFQRW